jgi:hypothetical protein
LLVISGAYAAPEFAPNPRQAFEGFAAINPPRASVPVGALWIEKFGPTGPGALTDNLESERSLNVLTIDKNLQLALSIGLLDLIGINPKLRNHYVARFSDLSVIRVKDITKLDGPKGEPRIIEALKAGSIIISSDSGFSLNAQTVGFQQRNASGTTANDRARFYSIEARDMIIAIHVATPELVKSEVRELRLSKDLKTAQIDDFLLLIGRDKCSAQAACRPAIGVAKENSFGAVAPSGATELSSDFTARLSLPVPVADGKGGLFDAVLLRWIASCAEAKSDGCKSSPRLFAQYLGTRLSDADVSKVKGW